MSLQLNIHLTRHSVTITAQQKRSLLLPVHPGSTSMRWRGATMRRMSMFADPDTAHQAFAEDAIRNEMENGKRLCRLSSYSCGYVPRDTQPVHCMARWVHITESLVILCVPEERNLVEELVDLSTRDRIRAIRDLPMSFEEKKQIRCVLIEKHFKVICFLVVVYVGSALTITLHKQP